MKAQKLGTPPDDIRTEWRRLDDVIDDLNQSNQTASSHSHLISLSKSPSGGTVIDLTGLVQALAQRGIVL